MAGSRPAAQREPGSSPRVKHATRRPSVVETGVRLVTLAPAKVNLVLRVGRARPDGYHELRSLMVPLDLADAVQVSVSTRRGQVTCVVPGHPELDGAGNLAARAAEAFRRRFGVERGIAVRIVKRTPITAGLGGGSSDAAAVLRCLAAAFRIRDRAALSELALAIGSDVPFFLGPGPAWAGGRGERLSPLRLPVQHLVLLYPREPGLAIRAGDAYRWLDEARRGHAVPRLPRWPVSLRPTQRGNDLQPGCIARHPALGRLLGTLKSAGATVALMSGSGPTVFGLFGGRTAARRAAKAVLANEDETVEVFVARTVHRPPRVLPWRSPRSASSRSARRS
jgi:4-diphosphocytidyl-2-C-methyl-D-erythritol kinase